MGLRGPLGAYGENKDPDEDGPEQWWLVVSYLGEQGKEGSQEVSDQRETVLISKPLKPRACG